MTKQRDNQQEIIMKCCYMLFKEKGYINTTTREIAEHCNIGKGTLHYYFNKKESIIELMYTDFIEGITKYLSKNNKENNKDDNEEEIDGFTIFSMINIIFYRIASSRSFFIRNLVEILSNNNLLNIKINNSLKTCIQMDKDFNMNLTEYQIKLALIAVIGAESQLMINISQGNLKTTYEKMAGMINNMFFTLIKIDDETRSKIKIEAEEKTNNIDIDNIINYMKENYSWFID